MSKHNYVTCDWTLPHLEVKVVDIIKKAIKIVKLGKPSLTSLGSLILELNKEKYHKVTSGETLEAAKSSEVKLEFGSTGMYGDLGKYITLRTVYKGETFYAMIESGSDDSWIAGTDGIYKVKHGKLWERDGERKAVWFNANGEELNRFFKTRYLISGRQVAIFDMETDRVERTCSVKDLSFYFDSIDAGVRCPQDNVLFVFSEDKMMPIDMQTGLPMLEAPLPIKPVDVHWTGNKFLPDINFSLGVWKGMPFSTIDAAFAYKNQIFFFNANQYARFDMTDLEGGAYALNQSGYPRLIHPNTWPGLGYTSVCGAFSGNDQKKVYIFSKDTYVRFDMAKDLADENYPLNTQRNWAGLPFSNITAAF